MSTDTWFHLVPETNAIPQQQSLWSAGDQDCRVSETSGTHTEVAPWSCCTQGPLSSAQECSPLQPKRWRSFSENLQVSFGSSKITLLDFKLSGHRCQEDLWAFKVSSSTPGNREFLLRISPTAENMPKLENQQELCFDFSFLLVQQINWTQLLQGQIEQFQIAKALQIPQHKTCYLRQPITNLPFSSKQRLAMDLAAVISSYPAFKQVLPQEDFLLFTASCFTFLFRNACPLQCSNTSHNISPWGWSSAEASSCPLWGMIGLLSSQQESEWILEMA